MRELRVPGGILVTLLVLSAPAVSAADTPAPATPAPTPAAKPAPAPAAQGGAPGAAPAPAATPLGSPAPAPVAAASNSSPAAGTYTVRLRDLERKVNELKEQIFRSKARLNLLRETVLRGVVAGSRSLIMHRNEMGSTYTLVRLAYALDGLEIFAKSDDSGHLSDTQEFEVFNGSIVPGNHTLSVLMVYQGNGYGVFSYLKGYKFNVRASHTFAAGEGKQSQIKVVGFEKGNPITTDPKDRPAIDFRVNIVSDKAASIDKGGGVKADEAKK